MSRKLKRILRNYYKDISESVTTPDVPQQLTASLNISSAATDKQENHNLKSVDFILAAAACLIFFTFSLTFRGKSHELDIRIVEYHRDYNITNQVIKGLESLRNDFQYYYMLFHYIHYHSKFVSYHIVYLIIISL